LTQLLGDGIQHQIHAIDVVGRNRSGDLADVRRSDETVGVHAQDRQSGLERLRGVRPNARIDLRAMRQHQSGQLHAVARGERRRQDHVIAIARTYDQRAGGKPVKEFRSGTNADHGIVYPAGGQIALHQHLRVQMARNVERARRQQYGVTDDHSPQGNLSERDADGLGVEFDGRLVDDAACNMAAQLLHARGQVTEFFPRIPVRGAGDQHNLGLQTAYDLGVEPRREWIDRFGLHALADQHIGALGRTHAKTDDVLEQLRFVAGRHARRGLRHRQRIRRVDLANRPGKVKGVIVGGIVLRHGLDEADAQTLMLQGADETQRDGGQSDMLPGGNDKEDLHGVSSSSCGSMAPT